MEKELTKSSNALKDQRDFYVQLQEAEAFFNDENLPMNPKYLTEDNPYADKDGLVEFIVGVELTKDEEVMKMLTTQKKYLVAITSIVTDYINRYAEAYGEQYKTDPAIWTLAMSKIPLMGPSKVDEQSYSKHIKGISIATEFVEFLLEVVASEGSSALTSFSKFLSKQSDAIKFGIEKNEDYYRTITIGVCVEVFMVGDQIVYTPKVKQYRVEFDRKNSKWTSACVSAEFVDINFDYKYAANVFDYEGLEDPKVKKDFEKFIRQQRKAQIDGASTFFNGDFPPKEIV